MSPQPQFLNNFVAIQNTNESFFSYLPYISTCQYTNPSFIVGSAQFNPIEQADFFHKIQQDGEVKFWDPVFYGYDMALVLPSSISGYQGYIFYNSPIIKRNRQIILFSVNESGLIFYYTYLSINNQNLKITFNIQNTQPVNLSSQAESILLSCDNITSTNFAFMGNDTFIFACGT